MPHQVGLFEILAGVSSILFGFWVFFPLITLRALLESRGKLRDHLREIPRSLFASWCLFAFFRIALVIYPMPIVFAVIKEPLGTYLFVAAGVICLALLIAVEMRRPTFLPGRPVPQVAPVGSFDITGSVVAAAPICPQCGVPMIVRVAKQGPRQGQKFYGCPNFPTCRETHAL